METLANSPQIVSRENSASDLDLARATHFLSGGGEMGARIRAFDWSPTAIGAPDTWSPTLRMMVRFLLANRFPLLLWWGPDYISIYNDAYRPVLGTKHPWGLGKPGGECWAEIWDVLKPLVDAPFNGGPSTWMEDIELYVQRKGFTEETHFTVAYSPVPDEAAPSGIGGVLATVHEITGKVIGERRVAMLRDLGTRAAEAKTAEVACARAAETLAKHPKDVPFALLYLIEPDGKNAQLAASSSIDGASDDFYPLNIELDGQGAAKSPWPLGVVHSSEQMHVVENLSARFKTVPPGPWPETPHTAVVLPIASTVAGQFAGFLVAGVSARVALDEAYRDFFQVAVGPIATAITNARAYDQERRRADTLADLDRTKTAFFSNVSHEFRTPLTLMLGPLEGLLARSRHFAPEDHEQIETAHRNSLRLLNLVNTLLDFSRIEAGRFKATYRPVDVAALTEHLAANFRAALENAGLVLTVDCPPLPDAVYVDPAMWEKIVLNLLSNAFKFTFSGGVTVRLRAEGGKAVLSVSDTGTGIPQAELPHIFERFHRVEGAKGRSFEGSGIGLALIQELAKMHGGGVTAQSCEGEGSTFTVSVPFGKAHIPTDRIGESQSLQSTGMRTQAWLLDGLNRETESRPPARNGANVRAARIVIADDNADMREHVSRILGETYAIATAVNGEEALSLVRENPPDLLVTDIMMPGLDGVQLLRAVRHDSATRTLPVILLSARAGEEARVEGIEAGADDYLVKPFTANELRARVSTHVQMARIRKEAEEALRESADWLAGQREALEATLNGAPLEISLRLLINTAVKRLGEGVRAVFYLANTEGTTLHHIVGMPAAYAEAIDGFKIGPESLACGLATHTGQPVLTADVTKDPLWAPWVRLAEEFDYRGCWSFPINTSQGTFVGTFAIYWREPREATARDQQFAALVTNAAGLIISRHNDAEVRRYAEDKLRQNQQTLARLIEHCPFGIYIVDSAFRIAQMNLRSQNGAFQNVRPLIGCDFSDAMHILWPEGLAAEIVSRFRQTLETGEPYYSRDFIHKRSDVQAVEAYEWELHRITLADGQDGVVCYYFDSTELRNAEAALRESEERLRLATEHAEIGFWDVDVINDILIWPPRVKAMFGISPDFPVSMFDFYNGLHPYDRAAVSEAYAAAADPRRRALYDVEYRTIGKEDNRIRWVAAKGRGVFDEHNHCIRVIGTAMDVTDRKATEARLAESKARYRALAEQVTDGIFIADPQGRYIDANGAAAEMLGYTLEELLQLNIRELLDPGEWERLPEQFQRLAAGQVVQNDWRFHRKDGSIFIGDLVGRQFPDGRLQGVVRDVTERRHIEDELRRANADLEQFAYSASHDLQEPIRNVAVYTEILATRCGAAFDDRTKQYLAFVINGAKRMDALVKDLLAYTQCGAAKDEVGASDAGAVLEQTLENLATTVADTHATVTRDTLPIVAVPQVQLQQLFQNLIGNAIKYRRDGVAPRINISSQRSGNQWIFSVNDNGIGIDSEHQDKVFGLFKRLHGEDKYAGTGIGLAICQKIVERHGGRIWVESGGEGMGSTFYFKLPAAAAS